MYLFAGSEEEEDVEMVEDDDKEDQGEKKVPTSRVHGSINYTWSHGSPVAQWKSAWLKTEGPRVRVSPASQDTFILA